MTHRPACSLGLAVLAGLVAACAPLVVQPPVSGPELAAPWPAQTLYRVRYEGPAGEGGLRLVLRQVAEERFQLLASDSLGRAAWSLELWDDEVLLVNHRERLSCVAGSELRVPELALRSLPLVAVPRVLYGRTPLPPPPGAADPGDWSDDSGSRWTLHRDDGRLGSWTLWQEGEPRLSWKRQSDGGVLSHLDGAQFRWRQVTREKLSPASYRRIEAPSDYPLEACESSAPGAGGEGPPAG